MSHRSRSIGLACEHEEACDNKNDDVRSFEACSLLDVVIWGFLVKQEQGFRWERTGRFFAIKEATDLSKKFDSLEANKSSSD